MTSRGWSLVGGPFGRDTLALRRRANQDGLSGRTTSTRGTMTKTMITTTMMMMRVNRLRYPSMLIVTTTVIARQRPTTKISQCCQHRRAAVPCRRRRPPFQSPASSRKMATITLPRQPQPCDCLAKKSPETKCSRRRTKKRKPTKTKSTEIRS
uniref:(northern house mosquito) hypothetical protein n=1 Tax=Culex pipiens TaxID=7175 RepID=A0A8D8ABF7_CULPI